MGLMEVIKGVFGPVVAGFWSHLHLSRYGAFKRLAIQRGIRTYYNEKDFWRDLIGPKFYAGGEQLLKLNDIVELKGFQLTEWFPRAPGTFWTEEGFQRRSAAQVDIERVTEQFKVYGPAGKYLMVTGGVGTTRILPHRGEAGQYRVLCATSSGFCDAGIPIVVLDDVCAAIEKPLLENHGIEVDLKGRLVALPFDLKELVLPARGTELREPLKDWLSSALHIPRYFIAVETTLHVKRYTSDFRLKAAAWTLFARESGGQIQPSFTYASFDPRSAESLERACDFITGYVGTHGGTMVFTDFDEHVRRLDAKYPLSEVIRGRVDARRDFEKLLSWGTALRGAEPD